MKVRMTKLAQGPDGKFEKGHVYNLSPEKAEAFIAADAAESVESAEPEISSPPVSSVSGIGEARAEELAALGIETVADLATLDAEAVNAVAEAIDGVGIKTVTRWIEEAVLEEDRT